MRLSFHLLQASYINTDTPKSQKKKKKLNLKKTKIEDGW